MAERYCSWKEKSWAANSSGWCSQTLSEDYTRKNGGREEESKSG